MVALGGAFAQADEAEEAAGQATLPAQQATAAPGSAEEAPIGLEEIIVTGTKREIAQQDTPIAISTITENQIVESALGDIRAISDLAPNVTLTNVVGFKAVSPGIRGTGATAILVTADTSVGFQIDGFGLSTVQSQFVELFDTQQVEIYRGPQGTLFGKSTTGGVVSVTTKRPVHNEWGGDLEYTYGSFKHGGDIKRTKVALNVPILDETLSLRIAYINDFDEGYYRNNKPASSFPNLVPLYAAFGLPAVNPPFPPELDTTAVGRGELLGGNDVEAAKVKLLWNPNDQYEAYFTYEYVRDRSDSVLGVAESEPDMLLPLLGFAGIAQTGGSPFKTGVSANTEGVRNQAGSRVDVDGYYLTQTLQLPDLFGLGDFEVKSITGWRDMEETLANTYTGEAFNNLFDAMRNLERQVFQQELRIVSDLDGPFNFVLGANYLRDRVDFRSIAELGFVSLLPVFNPGNGTFLDNRGFVNLDLDPLNDPGHGADFQDRRSWAVFFDGSYDLTDQLRFSAGVRFTRDAKDFTRWTQSGAPCGPFTKPKDMVIATAAHEAAGLAMVGDCLDARSATTSRGGLTAAQVSQRKLPIGGEQFATAFHDHEQWTRWTWRAALDYQINDETLAYLSYATGFLAGGYTETCSSPDSCRPFDQETNYNVEGGLKADLLNNTLRTNLAVFYGQYKNLQRNQVVPFTAPVSGITSQETITLNAGKSEMWGVELESTWVPVPELRIDLNVGYLDHEYLDFETDLDGDQVPDDASFLDIQMSGKLQAGASVTYDMDLDFGRISWNATYHYASEQEHSVFNSPYTQLEARSLLGFRISYHDPNERYRVTLWGRNMLDETFRTAANSVAGLWNFTQYGPPRAMGVEVAYSF
jgi:iron complex outermembrane receptor protein